MEFKGPSFFSYPSLMSLAFAAFLPVALSLYFFLTRRAAGPDGGAALKVSAGHRENAIKLSVLVWVAVVCFFGVAYEKIDSLGKHWIDVLLEQTGIHEVISYIIFSINNDYIEMCLVSVVILLVFSLFFSPLILFVNMVVSSAMSFKCPRVFKHSLRLRWATPFVIAYMAAILAFGEFFIKFEFLELRDWRFFNALFLVYAIIDVVILACLGLRKLMWALMPEKGRGA